MEQPRDLRPQRDVDGNVLVYVALGGGRGSRSRVFSTSAPPAQSAKFLRDLADDVERLGE